MSYNIGNNNNNLFKSLPKSNFIKKYDLHNFNYTVITFCIAKKRLPDVKSNFMFC